MSRVLKHGKPRKAKPAQRVTGRLSESAQEKGNLPSRLQKFPSNKLMLAKWYYRLLFTLFMILVIGLVLWGRKLTGI
ncbi:hypothetical protein GCM10010911_29170 [Paenibacillus nasutitermitis]|uniref:Uncharacterized protein n=1 Tax=Paenibacillus nasutitermitis TaxID=1652958 RepID=A0A917DTH2_9BACL|nr:hypothetical protein GCM10010911_29170 [Paenibacillus nasutitermitis]